MTAATARVSAGARCVSLLLAALLASLPVAGSESQRAYFSRFDDDADGRVSRSEYLAYLSRGFDDMDRNQDGRLEGGELPPGVRGGRARKRSALQRDLHAAFGRQDANGDGWLSLAELTAPPR